MLHSSIEPPPGPCIDDGIQTVILTSNSLLYLQDKNIGWESGRQKRASHPIPELKESLQLKWHDMEGKWPSDELVPDFEATSKVTIILV